jgi:hypothetical protein
MFSKLPVLVRLEHPHVASCTALLFSCPLVAATTAATSFAALVTS